MVLFVITVSISAARLLFLFLGLGQGHRRQLRKAMPCHSVLRPAHSRVETTTNICASINRYLLCRYSDGKDNSQPKGNQRNEH